MKRELGEIQQKLDAAEAALAQAEMEALGLEREVRELTAALENEKETSDAIQRGRN